jgi:hypothetical protein
LPTGNAPRPHHNVLGPGDADHLLQPRGTTRARDLAEALLGKPAAALAQPEPATTANDMA